MDCSRRSMFESGNRQSIFQAKSDSSNDGSNISGVEHAFNATGEGSKIQGEEVIINAGLGAGNPNFTASPIPVKGGGVSDAFNAKSGGKINLNRATVNAGAFAGGSRGSRTASSGYASGSNSRKHLDDKGKY